MAHMCDCIGLHSLTLINVVRAGGGGRGTGPAESWEPRILKSDGKGMGVLSTTHPGKTFLNQEMGA